MSNLRRLLAACVILLSACAITPSTSLYTQLGEQAGIARLVDAIIVEIQVSKCSSDLFAETDFPYFRERLIEQICQISDGPCEYTGLSMEEAHSGMDISETEFTAFVEEVEVAMRKIKLPLQTQNRLLAKFAKMRPEVIRM